MMNWNVFDIKRKVSNEPILRTTRLNVLIDNSDSVTEVASAVIGYEVLQISLISITDRKFTQEKCHLKH
jgi:hypothetical protein